MAPTIKGKGLDFSGKTPGQDSVPGNGEGRAGIIKKKSPSLRKIFLTFSGGGVFSKSANRDFLLLQVTQVQRKNLEIQKRHTKDNKHLRIPRLCFFFSVSIFFSSHGILWTLFMSLFVLLQCNA